MATRLTKSVRWGAILGIPLLLLAGGCQDPAYKTKQTARQERIEHLCEGWTIREQQRPDKIEFVTQAVRREEVRSVEQLDATLLLVKESQARDRTDWVEQTPERQEKIRTIFAGKPERIPETWRKLTY